MLDLIRENFHAVGWFGVFAAAGTPQPIITRLNAEISNTMKEAELRERLLAQGADALSSTPEELARHLAREIQIWSKVIREAGVKAE